MNETYRKIINALIDVTNNSVFSPVALKHALVLLGRIAGGNTGKQITDAVGSEKPVIDEMLENCSVSSSCWVNSDVNCRTEVLEIPCVYPVKMGVRETDNKIKEWVNRATGNMLDDTMDISTTNDTIIELLSTIYFKSAWSRKFKKDKSFFGSFYISESESTDCEFMQREIRIPYFKGDDYEAAAIGFSSCANVWFVMPKQGKKIEEILDSFLKSEYISLWEERKVHITVPKIDISEKTDLMDCMIKLGISDVFDPGLADFSVLSDTDNLYLSKAEQTTRIKWDEEGVEAASCVEMAIARACLIPESEVVELVLDRPFFYMITDFSDNPLFAGVVVRP